MNEVHYWLLIPVVLLGMVSAAFSALETAIFLLDEDRRRKLQARSPRRAQALAKLLEKPDEVANVLVLANTLANLPLIVVLLYGLGEFPGPVGELGWTVLTAAAAGFIFVCDLLPKLVALAAPVRTARWGVPLVEWLVPVLGPVCRGLHGISERMVAVLVPERIEPAPHLTDAELATLVEIGQSEGSIEETEGRLIAELMKLGEESAKHVMTPRVDVYFLTDDLTNEQVVEMVQRKRYRRVLVRGETPDDVLGLLDVKRFLLNPGTPYLEQLMPPSFVPETIPALDLLRSFLQRRQHFAILLDEYGGIEGVVTLSDFIEELMGEEGPDSQSELYIESLGNGRVVAAGSARLDDIGEMLEWALGDPEADSIGGFVVEQLGYLPRPGTVLTVAGRRITVRRATRKRIKEVLIEPTLEADERPNEDEEVAA